MRAERKQLEADLASAEKPPETVALHPTALARYRQQVEDLQKALSSESLGDDRAPVRALRELVAAIVVLPTARRAHRVEVRGRLAALIGHEVFPAARMWGGKVVAEERYRFSPQSRFIPACAGNAIRTLLCLRRITVHPRMRGERAATNAKERSRSVHPRMRGERTATVVPSLSETGSSPHARGTLLPLTGSRDMLRFIPACAGNAKAGESRTSSLTVHPRMRGERAFNRRALQNNSGSSPHARGTLIQFGPNTLLLRFIPACAGNADAGRFPLIGDAVHPRMRGERSTAVRL